MAKMEQKVENIDEGVKRIEQVLIKHIESEDKKHAQVERDFADRCEGMKKEFAPKWVEKAFIAFLLLIVAAFIGYVKS